MVKSNFQVLLVLNYFVFQIIMIYIIIYKYNY